MSLTEFCLEQSKVTDMKIADNASIDDNTHGGGEIPPCIGFTPEALPEVQEPVLAENSQTGVSLDFVPKENYFCFMFQTFMEIKGKKEEFYSLPLYNKKQEENEL